MDYNPSRLLAFNNKNLFSKETTYLTEILLKLEVKGTLRESPLFNQLKGIHFTHK